MTYIFLNVLNMSITASVIIIAVILIRLLIRNLPKKFSYILWLIPAVRLICPISVSASFSVFNLLKPKVEQNRMEYISQSFNTAATDCPAAVMPNESDVRSTAVVYAEQSENSISVTDIIVFIWFAVTISILVYCIISYMHVHRRIEHSCKKDGYYVCADIDTPFVFGIFHPKIYVPGNLSDSDIECVLAHENAHISRYDHIFKIVCVFITAVHWFNPLVWAACRLVTSDMELSCDEKALENMKGEMKKTYADSLLNISMRQNKISLTGITGFGESSIKRRIRYILTIKKPDMASIVFAVIVIIAASVTMLTNAETEIFNVTSELLSIDNKKENIPDNNYPCTSYPVNLIVTTVHPETGNTVSVSVSSTDSYTSGTENTTLTSYSAEPIHTEADNNADKAEEKPIHDNSVVPNEFKSMVYNGNCYSAFYDHGSRGYSALHSIPEDKIGKKLYDGNIECFKREDGSDSCKTNGSIYDINGISDNFGIAVKFGDINKYYLYANPSYYSESVGDFINNFSLRETLCPDPDYAYSAQHSYRNINDKGYYDLITEYYDIGVDFVLDMLLDNTNARCVSLDYLRLESPDYFIYCFVPLLNTHISFNIYEEYGCISAGAEEFYMGEEKVRKIIDRIQSEYPCCETLIDNGVQQRMVIGKYQP